MKEYKSIIMEISNVTKSVGEITICPDCKKELTPEERLLQAIFDDRQIKCQECYLKSKLPKCTKCGEPIVKSVEVYYRDQLYHLHCSPWLIKE